jgi:hypothetical protein
MKFETILERMRGTTLVSPGNVVDERLTGVVGSSPLRLKHSRYGAKSSRHLQQGNCFPVKAAPPLA